MYGLMNWPIWGRFEICLGFQGDKYGEISGWCIFTQKDTRNPIKPMKMTENEIKWLIFVNFVEKWLILKTWRDCVPEVDFTHRSMQNMLFLLRNVHCVLYDKNRNLANYG